MRIAYLNTEDLRKTSGGKVHYWAVASELSRLGHQVDVVAPLYGSGQWQPLDAAEAIRKVRIRVPGKGALGLFAFELIFAAILPWLRLRRRYDALLVRGGGVTVLLGLVFLIARALGIKVVLECNGVVWDEYRQRGSPPWFCRLVKFMAWQQAATASAVIGVTPTIRDHYLKLGCRTAGYAISNGVFTERIPFNARRDLRAAKGWADDTTVFLMPSEFAPWHKMQNLIEAIHLVPEPERARMRFVLPGKGMDFEAVKSLVSARGLEGLVALPGLLPREEVYSLLAAADVGLLFGQVGSPLKLFEYFGGGLRVMAPRDNYVGTILSFYGMGSLFPSLSTDAIAIALSAAAKGAYNENGRASIRGIAEREFHWRKVAERVAAVLEGREPVLEQWLTSSSPPAPVP